jgi:hypothetical protein
MQKEGDILFANENVWSGVLGKGKEELYVWDEREKESKERCGKKEESKERNSEFEREWQWHTKTDTVTGRHHMFDFWDSILWVHAWVLFCVFECEKLIFQGITHQINSMILWVVNHVNEWRGLYIIRQMLNSASEVQLILLRIQILKVFFFNIVKSTYESHNFDFFFNAKFILFFFLVS